MAATIYYENDADLSHLKGKKVAILGYGSQGHAQAQNLRDSGCEVIIGQRPGSANYDLAVSHGFEPMSIAEATKAADVINVLLPDEVQADIYRDSIRDNLSEGNVLMCSHGFNIHFGQIDPPKGIDTLLVAPKGPGHLVRSEYEKGGGVPALIALGEGASETTKQIGLAYAKGIGGTRGGVIETTFAEETETDLFGEQVVLCGGVSELVKAGFDTLVEAGYQPEMAYFECMHELKLIVDLLYEGGLSYMRYSISNTAEYGDYVTGPRIITDETKAEMKKVLEEIQQGEFARKWISENRAGAPFFKATRRRERLHGVEQIGLGLRRMMNWIDEKKFDPVGGPVEDSGRTPKVTGSVQDWTQLQIDCVRRWHDEPMANPYSGWLRWVCQQHAFNFELWHEEDVARNPSVTDARIAEVKRSIDRLNQQRNDWIEKLDDAITESIQQSSVVVAEDAPINTETPGSAIDRLSIMSLRLFHYAEQLQRQDVDAEHRSKVEARWLLCQVQHADLSASLQTLIDDIFAGRKRHKTYRQMKMYNDPSLNPEMSDS